MQLQRRKQFSSTFYNSFASFVKSSYLSIYLFIYLFILFYFILFYFIYFSAKIQMSTYAFSAYEISDRTPSTGDTLVFTKTFVNENEAYSTRTGVYTAPCDGIYEFHATLTSDASYPKKYLYVEFKAGETSIGKFMVYDTVRDDSSSGSAIARLQKGTEVFLRVTTLHSRTRLLDDSYRMNSFNGHLISK